MTIRRYLEGRCSRTVAGTMAFLIIIGIAFNAVPRIFILRFVLAVLVAALAMAAFWSLFEIPCPNCRRSLGTVGFRVANGLSRQSSPHCPHCDISIDAPMPVPAKPV
jgi:hypothetical protein